MSVHKKSAASMLMTSDTLGGTRKKSIGSLLTAADGLVASARALLHVSETVEQLRRVSTVARRCSSLINLPPEAHQRRRSVLPGFPMPTYPRVKPAETRVRRSKEEEQSNLPSNRSTASSEDNASEQQQANKLRTSNLARLARIARRSSSVRTCDPEQLRPGSQGPNRWFARRASIATSVTSEDKSQELPANTPQPIDFYTPTMMALRARLRWDSKIR